MNEMDPAPVRVNKGGTAGKPLVPEGREFLF